MSAIQRLDYISYTLITLTSCHRATFVPIFESSIIAELSSLLAKPIDRSDNRNISIQDWCSIAVAVECKTQRVHGDGQADALQHHYQNVIGVSQMHSWQIAVDYDIQQRELACIDKRHNYSTLDGNTILLITTKATLQSMEDLQVVVVLPSKWCFIKELAVLSVSSKKQHGANCFWCGLVGHLPANCSTSVTMVGKLPVPLLPNAKSPQSLQAPNGFQFCFTFATWNACRFGNTCSFVHACSLCGGSSYSAGSCQA
ncbi:hypothetical protein AN958_06528 [Leucoagaricus sp. SymC.cos]|nr:hypothetical protein AN958_06528 [Leucoagaricus sp. SymC.cos]